mgnify:CR=1 FL=1
MCPGTHKHHQAALAGVVQRVDQQEVAADMAIAMACPIACQRVIKPFGRQWPVVGDEQRHGLFQPVHVVPTGVGQALWRVINRIRSCVTWEYQPHDGSGQMDGAEEVASCLVIARSNGPVLLEA